MSLPEFLLARITEDEQTARRAAVALCAPGLQSKGEIMSTNDFRRNTVLEFVHPYDQDSLPIEAHIEAWSTTRVLAECEAKRRIIAEHTHADTDSYPPYPNTRAPGFGCTTCHVDPDLIPTNTGWCATLRALAVPYTNYTGYDAAWGL